jgi:hypothetical protein
MLALANMWSNSEERQLRVVEGLGVTAAACCVVLMLYNAAAFGSPLEIGYRFEQGFEGMQQGLMGVTYPKLFPLTGILVIIPLVTLLLTGLAAGVFLVPVGALFQDVGHALGVVASSLVFLTRFNLVSLLVRRLVVRSTHHVRGASIPLPGTRAAVESRPADRTRRHGDPRALRRRPRVHRGRGHGAAVYRLWAADRGALLAELSARRAVAEPSVVRRERLVKAPDPVAHAWNLGERMGLSGKTSLVPLLGVWAALGIVGHRPPA